MLISDTPYQERGRWRKALERTREITQSTLREQKRQVAETERTVDGFDPTNLIKQMGRPLHPNEFMRRLAQLNSALQFKLGPAGGWAILKPTPVRHPDGGEKLELTYTGISFENQVMPEYTVLKPEYDTAWDSESKDIVKTLRTVREVRGWRTVVGRLLMAGLVSPTKVRELFSTDSNTRASWAGMEKNAGVNRRVGPIILP